MYLRSIYYGGFGIVIPGQVLRWRVGFNLGSLRQAFYDR
jgi:hypothetical protein